MLLNHNSLHSHGTSLESRSTAISPPFLCIVGLPKSVPARGVQARTRGRNEIDPSIPYRGDASQCIISIDELVYIMCILLDIVCMNGVMNTYKCCDRSVRSGQCNRSAIGTWRSLSRSAWVCWAGLFQCRAHRTSPAPNLSTEALRTRLPAGCLDNFINGRSAHAHMHEDDVILYSTVPPRPI